MKFEFHCMFVCCEIFLDFFVCLKTVGARLLKGGCRAALAHGGGVASSCSKSKTALGEGEAAAAGEMG